MYNSFLTWLFIFSRRITSTMDLTIFLKKVLLWTWVIIFTPSLFASPATLPEGTNDGFIYENFREQQYLTVNITPQRKNNPADVIKLQKFLNEFQGETLVLTGQYDRYTQEAVNRFQLIFEAQILTPWGLKQPTGNVGVLTRAKINNIVYGTDRKIYCPGFSHSIRLGDVSPDVPYLRSFLQHLGYNLSDLSSFSYDQEMVDVVKMFQKDHADTVLIPMGIRHPTGNWYISTKHAANLLVGCSAPEVRV